MNKMITTFSKIISISLTFIAAFAFAQNGVGKQLASDAMALVSYLELSNIGSRDIECKGTPFEVINVNAVIDSEIKSALVKLAATERKNNSKEIEEMISVIKQIPFTSKDGKYVLQSTYEKLKQDSFTTYGKQGGCASLSASLRSVVQQRRLSIRNYMNQ